MDYRCFWLHPETVAGSPVRHRAVRPTSDHIVKSWNVEVGSPREFFREVLVVFLASGYSITEQREPSLGQTAMQNVAEFNGAIRSSERYKERVPPVLLLVGLLMFFSGLWLLYEVVRSLSSAPYWMLGSEFVGGIFLALVGWGIIRPTSGTIWTTLKMTGEAYQSRTSARMEANIAQERSGIYSRATLTLLFTSDFKADKRALQWAASKSSSLAERIDAVTSRYVILRDAMLLDSSERRPAPALLADDGPKACSSCGAVLDADKSNIAVIDEGGQVRKLCGKCAEKKPRA